MPRRHWPSPVMTCFESRMLWHGALFCSAFTPRSCRALTQPGTPCPAASSRCLAFREPCEASSEACSWTQLRSRRKLLKEWFIAVLCAGTTPSSYLRCGKLMALTDAAASGSDCRVVSLISFTLSAKTKQNIRRAMAAPHREVTGCEVTAGQFRCEAGLASLTLDQADESRLPKNPVRTPGKSTRHSQVALSQWLLPGLSAAQCQHVLFKHMSSRKAIRAR